MGSTTSIKDLLCMRSIINFERFGGYLEVKLLHVFYIYTSNNLPVMYDYLIIIPTSRLPTI
jgi:hypothetical protein